MMIYQCTNNRERCDGDGGVGGVDGGDSGGNRHRPTSFRLHIEGGYSIWECSSYERSCVLRY